MACETLKQKFTTRLEQAFSPNRTISLMSSTTGMNISASLSSVVNLTFMNTNAQNGKTGSGQILPKCCPKMNLNTFLASLQ